VFIDEAIFEHLDEDVAALLCERSVNAVPADAERIELFHEGRYAAHAHDLGFGWRWALTRDGREIQEGAALSQASASSSARRVLAFYARIEGAAPS